MKLKSTLIIRIALIVFTVIYAATILEPLINPQDDAAVTPSQWEIITVVGCFILYLAGVIFSWFNLKWSGIILIAYHFLVWLFAMTLWHQAGMVLFLVFPILVCAVLLLRNWAIQEEEIINRDIIATQYTLDLLLVNYSIIYLLVVVIQVLSSYANVEFATSGNNTLNLNSLAGIVLLIELLVFTSALLILKKHRILSGILLIIWYAGIVILSFTNFDFFNSGPWVFIALPVLINGIFYIKDGRRMAFSSK